VYRTDYEAIFGLLDDAIGTFPASGKPMSPLAGSSPGVWETALSPNDRNTVNIVLANWGKAIAAYEYELVSTESAFDAFVRAGWDSNLISGAAQRGARLFVDKAACIDCHSGPMLTDDDFHNIGVAQTGLGVPTTDLCPVAKDDVYACDCVDGPRCAPWGALEGLWRLQNDGGIASWVRSGPYSDDKMDDSRSAYTHRALTADLKGAWRTPSLRNVALTAPYMHDGSLATLEDVVWHYNTGGRGATGEHVGDPAAEIKPLGLTADEISDLVAFLETLTGDPPPPDSTKAPTPR
jgi:cytochrome c peroxidase